MLRIVEVSSEARLEELRQQEVGSCDYLYICKYCNSIKLSDNGTLKNFTRIRVCETQEEYNNITKEDILYIVNIDENTVNLYFGDTQISSASNGNSSTSSSIPYTSEEISVAISEIWTVKEEQEEVITETTGVDDIITEEE